ncbi:hypothetical protein ACQ4PT_061704 [Festuca glaucescens]
MESGGDEVVKLAQAPFCAPACGRKISFGRILPKIAAHWIINLYRAARKLRSDAFQYNRNSNTRLSTAGAAVSRCTIPSAVGRMVVFDFHGGLRAGPKAGQEYGPALGGLLRSTALFPYFMLVAFEGGSLFRALLLLCCFPLVWVLGEQVAAGIRVMAFVTFVGLRPQDADLVARAILPKFYMERLNALVYDHLWLPAGRKVAVTSAPRVMAEWFLKEYMAADVVAGCELQIVKVGRRCYFTGLLCEPGPGAPALREVLGTDGAMADVAVVGSSNPLDHFVVPYCKELYIMTKESAKTARLPRARYPKPLIFHDGRLAFLPTASATVAFFLFLPLGLILSVIRISIGIVLPYNISFVASALFGVRFRTSGLAKDTAAKRRGVLFPSRLSEIIAPIRTVRLTRDRDRDAAMMSRLLEQGDLAVCPEGTTCREPYLLRFSPLFAELADDMEPVALDAQVTSLYGTTASCRKWLDPVAFFANPAPAYRVEFSGRCAAGSDARGGQDRSRGRQLGPAAAR